MKTLPLILVALFVFAPTVVAESAADRYDALLDRYVRGNAVRYDAWREEPNDRAALATIVTAFGATDPAELEPQERFALYINLYNAKTLQLVLEGNPVNSIRDLSSIWLKSGVFLQRVIEFEGERISLHRLETRLREEAGDARVHFAVNCASRSCPALLDEAFRGDRLEEQLERQSFAFLLRDDALLVDDANGHRVTVQLSKIFDWYSGDFGGDRGVRRFIRTYAPEKTRSRLTDTEFTIGFLQYDWNLNRAE